MGSYLIAMNPSPERVIKFGAMEVGNNFTAKSQSRSDYFRNEKKKKKSQKEDLQCLKTKSSIHFGEFPFSHR